jgi:DNA adenine methylase
MHPMTATVRSPIIWVGGKYYSASRILAAFPPPDRYSTYVEVFGGAGHVLCRKPPYNHLEVYNDLNGDLVNFWMHCRNNPQELQHQIDSLPYSRQLYYQWHQELFTDTPVSDMERAVKWFYVLRSCFGGLLRKSKTGWAYTIQRAGSSQAKRLHTATSLFASVSERLRNVQIEHQDFAKLITTYASPTTLFYCDPPYIDKEEYYEYQDVPLFGEADHRRLAALLNATKALVALSYYPHPLVDEPYPAEKWRRCTWHTSKCIPKTTTTRAKATELLLLNYPEQPPES